MHGEDVASTRQELRQRRVARVPAPLKEPCAGVLVVVGFSDALLLNPGKYRLTAVINIPGLRAEAREVVLRVAAYSPREALCTWPRRRRHIELAVTRGREAQRREERIARIAKLKVAVLTDGEAGRDPPRAVRQLVRPERAVFHLVLGLDVAHREPDERRGVLGDRARRETVEEHATIRRENRKSVADQVRAQAARDGHDDAALFTYAAANREGAEQQRRTMP